jgi:monovalent cation:H+ antiporter-2, CPA2 family
VEANVQSTTVILTLAGALAFALVLGYLAHRIGLSPIVGYLVAGILVGPATPGFVADRETAQQFAEIGIVLLMFGVGLQFHFRELLAVKRVAIPGAVIQTAVVMFLGALVLVGTGGGWQAGLVYGFALSIGSTVVLVRVLSDNDQLHAPTGHIAIGWEVLKDLFTVIALVLIPLFVGAAKQTGGAAALDVLFAVLKIVGLVLFAVFVGGRLVPWLLSKVAATRSRELFTLTILVIALGIAVGAARLFGVSMALGALLAGMIVGRSEFSFRAASEALPMRDAFAVLFFVSVGMLFDPAAVVHSAALIVLTLAVILIAKPLVALGVCAALGYPSRVGLGVSAALGQIGEFSFVIAALAVQLGAFSTEATNALIGAAIVSICVASPIYRTVGPINRWLSRHPRAWAVLNVRSAANTGAGLATTPTEETDPAHRAVVIGHGPVGRTLVRLLSEQDIKPTVIEMNLSTVQDLNRAGVTAILGDATLETILEQAGVRTAGSLFLTVSGFQNAKEVIKIARGLNPGIRILARAAYLADIPDLREAGADKVFSGEGEVALGMTESLLTLLGATPEQIDRERARVHGELF